MPNGVQRFADMPVATVFSSSGYSEDNLAAVLFVDPEKNAITPIFLANDRIKSQEQLDKKLAEGWETDGYDHAPVLRWFGQKKKKE
ncbi:unnamed protein product, partial [Mesorhabditis spiculigera]